jgi:PAS domain S-box-containing protein
MADNLDLNLIRTIESQYLQKYSMLTQTPQSEADLLPFKQFLEVCPIGIFVIDAEGHPYYANQKALDILGKGVLASATIDQLNVIYQSYQVETNQLYSITENPLIRALQGESTTVEDMEIHQGGQIIPLEFSAVPIFNSQGKIIFAIAIFQDISDRRRQETKQEQLRQEFIRKNQGLLQENQSLKAAIERQKAEIAHLKTQFQTLSPSS